MRLPPVLLLGGAYAATSGCATDETDSDLVSCLAVFAGEVDADSLESDPLRRREISTVTV